MTNDMKEQIATFVRLMEAQDMTSAAFGFPEGEGNTLLVAVGEPDALASMSVEIINRTQDNAFTLKDANAKRYKRLLRHVAAQSPRVSVSVQWGGGDWNRISDPAELSALLDDERS